jgi:hypothetical protein
MESCISLINDIGRECKLVLEPSRLYLAPNLTRPSSSNNMWIAIAGIAAEIFGFVLMIRSAPLLELRQGDFVSDVHIDPNTGEPIRHIEGPRIQAIYRPGIYLVVAGLAAQAADIVIAQLFKFPL